MPTSPHAIKFKSHAEFKKYADENDIQYVGFEFTDPRGKMHHTDQHISTIDEDMFKEGVMIDGSSIAGWKAINESDMRLVPDWGKCFLDPFAAQPTIKVFCTIYEPLTGEGYGRCPRTIAERAEAYVKKSGLADTAYFGPEAEFFIFDDVKFDVKMNKVSY